MLQYAAAPNTRFAHTSASSFVVGNLAKWSETTVLLFPPALLVKRCNQSGYLAGLLRSGYAALVSPLLSESAAQKAILLPGRLKVPEKKVLTEVISL